MLTDPLNQPIASPVIRYKSPGSINGPKIVLTCLNHGDEVIGLNTAFELIEYFKQNKDLFNGEIVIFSCLNYQGFLSSSRFFEGENFNGNGVPNLNRIWPGDDKSYAGLFAGQTFQQIMEEKPDFVLDLHAYASNSVVHTIVDRPGGELEEELIKVCKKSQAPFYLEYEAETFETQSLDKSLSNQLCIQGVPALTVELGPIKGFSLYQSKIALQALLNLVKAVDETSSVKTLNLYELQKVDIDMQKTYYRDTVLNDSNFSGYYRPVYEVGRFVCQGVIIAEVLNLYGQVVHQIKMPKSGYLIALEDVCVVCPNIQLGVYISEISEQ